MLKLIPSDAFKQVCPKCGSRYIEPYNLNLRADKQYIHWICSDRNNNCYAHFYTAFTTIAPDTEQQRRYELRVCAEEAARTIEENRRNKSYGVHFVRRLKLLRYHAIALECYAPVWDRIIEIASNKMFFDPKKAKNLLLSQKRKMSDMGRVDRRGSKAQMTTSVKNEHDLQRSIDSQTRQLEIFMLGNLNELLNEYLQSGREDVLA